MGRLQVLIVVVLATLTIGTPRLAGAQSGGVPALLEQHLALEARVVALEAVINELQTALEQERAARLAAEAALQAAIDAEAAARAAADAALEERVAVVASGPLADLAQFIRVDPNEINGLRGPHVIVEGANVHVLSGSGSTDDGGTPTGLGNLIIGYNEPLGFLFPGARGGSHNLVVGPGHSFFSTGGFVAGSRNTLGGQSASVTGGEENRASGFAASVTGGRLNDASGPLASVSGAQATSRAAARRA